MKEVEDKSTRISKKIRNKLIYYTYLDIIHKPISKNHLLINSMTYNDLNNKYQKCSDYCVKKIEIYTSSKMNNEIVNNNYFHISVTYCSLNNNYHMLVDNKDVEQYIGNNNIVGKYYKGNTIQIGTTSNKFKYNISFSQNKLEKRKIGEKKLPKKRRDIASSLNITKNFHIINNEIEQNNLKSNNNDENHKKLIKDEIEKIQSNFGNKIKKTNTQKIINKYMIKLKKYCSSLITIDRIISKKESPHKMSEPPTPASHKKRKNKNDKCNLRSDKDKPIIEPTFYMSYRNFNNSIIPENNNYYPCHQKLKSQTRIINNNFRMRIKSSFKNNMSMNKFEEESVSPKKYSRNKIFSPKNIFSLKNNTSQKKNDSPKKYYSPKKNSSPKKIGSPKKNRTPRKGIFEFKYEPGLPSTFFGFYKQFINKRGKENQANIKKNILGNKLDLNTNKKKENEINTITYSKFISNEKLNSNASKGKNNINVRKAKLKKSLTINKRIYKFRSGQILEKKVNNAKKKDNKH